MNSLNIERNPWIDIDMYHVVEYYNNKNFLSNCNMYILYFLDTTATEI